MRRRQFITLLAGAAAWPLVARAQQAERMRRIGVLLSSSGIDPEGQARIASLRLGLLELGWIEGRNITIDYRWGAGDSNRVRAQAADLVASKPDVIVASPSSVLAAVQRETRTIPVVFAQLLIRSAPASSPALRIPAAISPVLPTSNFQWVRNGCSCSRRSHHQ